MSNSTERAKGTLEKVSGVIKESIGKVIGNERLEAEGKTEQFEGNARIELAKATERAKGTFEQAAGVVKHKVGQVIGNDVMAAEGKAKALKGEVRQSVNK
jgi:uncharacterized protein YjbJ (UPF0337 family)